jgi:hypothetical protein
VFNLTAAMNSYQCAFCDENVEYKIWIYICEQTYEQNTIVQKTQRKIAVQVKFHKTIKEE